MKIKSLRLKGFIGIQRGLGLDEITIDFSDVSGLVAIAGQNGAGKSSVLENLHAFPQLASRDGALYHHCFRRDSERELVFEYGGHEYRTLIKIDAQGEKQEGYAWKDGISEVNGKISSYSRYIRDLLGSPDLFFASVFCAQNSRKLSDMTTGQLKGLYAEFLRLDRLQEYENTAKQAGAVVGGRVSQVEARIAALEGQLTGKADLEDAYEAAGGKAEDLRDDKTYQEGLLAEARESLDAIKQQAAQLAGKVARRDDLARMIANMERDMADAAGIALSEIEVLRNSWWEMGKELAKADATLADRERIEEAAASYRTASAALAEVQAGSDTLIGERIKATDTVHVSERRLLEARQALKDLDSNPEREALEKAIEAAKQRARELAKEVELLEHDRETTRLLGQIENALEKTAALDQRDPACQSTTCSFIVGALEAERELPGLQQRLETRREQVAAEIDAIRVRVREGKESREQAEAALERCNQAHKQAVADATDKANAARAEHKAAAGALAEIEHMTRNTQDAITHAKAALESLAALSARLPEIKIAEARKGDLEKQIAENVEKGRRLKGAWTAREAELKAKIDAEKGSLGELSREIAASDPNGAAATEKEIAEIQAKIADIEKRYQAAREEVTKIRTALDQLATVSTDLEAARAERDRLAAEVADWAYLRTACGKNGLQALEIDGAAPLITAFANDLLAKSFGRTYSVKLLTQDDEGKETLDIIVIGDDGSEDLLENKSGGEKVFCLMALRLAMTLLSKEKSGLSFLSAFSDESDGALDPENALNYVAMYRSFMEVGGFKDFYFISHRPECRNLADHILAFEHGKNPYWR